MDEIKMGRPDYTTQTAQYLPQPERLVIVLILRGHKLLKKSKISFSELYEQIKKRVTEQELTEALGNLKEIGLISCLGPGNPQQNT